ncbi:hypothetical protein RB595_007090 [Gaeumannomyces hyphopodioides]
MLLLVALPLLGLSQVVGAQSCAYTGGWALRNAGDCPPAAPIRCGTGLQPRCCPSGQVCTGEGAYVGNYCCAPGEDCTRKATEAPKCPDPSFTLWGVDNSTNNGGWCCLSSADGMYERQSDNTIAVGCNPRSGSLGRNQFQASPLNAVASCAPTTRQPSTTQSSSVPAQSSPGATESPQPPPAAESQALGSGAIAGIAVGATVGGALLALLVVGIVVFRRRRSRMSQAGTGTAVEAASGTPKHHPGGAFNDQKGPYSPYRPYAYTAQSAVSGYQEMPHANQPQELGFGAPTEMEDPSTLRQAELGDGRPHPGR